MAKKQSIKKVIWAVDPFEREGETRSHVISMLRQLLDVGFKVEPVYVMSPEEFELSLEFKAPWLKQQKPTIQRMLQRVVENSQLPGLLQSQVLMERRPSLARSVHHLVDHAKKQRAEMIVIGTHARKGLPRFFLGSFAESVLLYSKVPVMVVGPHVSSAKLNHILFATDFGKKASALFDRVMHMAKGLGAKVTLFYSVPRPIEPVLQSGVYLFAGTSIAVPELATQDEQKKRKVADAWVAAAQKRGVRVDVLFDSEQTGVVQSILNTAENYQVSLIAMAAESGPLAAALIGSVTRQVVRGAPSAVWVMRV